MTRPNETYRSERRNNWRAACKLHGRFPWATFNRPAPKYQLGTHLPGDVFHAVSHVARSKYMPHIGKKERARHAA